MSDANPDWSHARIKGRLPDFLTRCPGCFLHIYAEEKKCPHCRRNIAALYKQQAKALERAEKALARLQKALGGD